MEGRTPLRSSDDAVSLLATPAYWYDYRGVWSPPKAETSQSVSVPAPARSDTHTVPSGHAAAASCLPRLLPRLPPFFATRSCNVRRYEPRCCTCPHPCSIRTAATIKVTAEMKRTCRIISRTSSGKIHAPQHCQLITWPGCKQLWFLVVS